MKKVLTLSVILDGKRILLGMKKRGFGAGMWNGFGGKVRAGETLEESFLRECKEEAGIVPQNAQECAQFQFYYADENIHEVHVFLVTAFEGQPQESQEMKPQWFALKDIPYDSMWPDDRYWLPRVLAGEKLRGEFWFDKKNMLVKWKIEPKAS